MNTQERKNIESMGTVQTGQPVGGIHCLTIIGQIEGHQNAPEDAKTTKYEHIMPLLAAVEESPEIQGLLILLNTMGGDVEAGLGIAELIAGMSKPTASLVLGGGHCPQCGSNHPSRSYDRGGHRRAPNVQLFCQNPGADCPIHHRPFQCHARAAVGVYDVHRCHCQ